LTSVNRLKKAFDLGSSDPCRRGATGDKERAQAVIAFLDPDGLIDDDLEVSLFEECPGGRDTNLVPTYRFRMTPVDRNEETGRIEARIGDSSHIAHTQVTSATAYAWSSGDRDKLPEPADCSYPWHGGTG